MLTLITRQDVLEAIAECQGMRSPNANTAVKLAAFYTILDHMDEQGAGPVANDRGNSFAGYSLAESDMPVVRYDGASDFARAIDGRSQADVWPVMDELMTTLKAMNERLYHGVLRRLSE